MTKKEVAKWDARIKKGIAFLDRNLGRKKWSKKIRLDDLNMESVTTCMIGETMGNYHKIRCSLGKSHEEMQEMGFAANSDTYPALTRLWIGALYKLGIKG